MFGILLDHFVLAKTVTAVFLTALGGRIQWHYPGCRWFAANHAGNHPPFQPDIPTKHCYQLQYIQIWRESFLRNKNKMSLLDRRVHITGSLSSIVKETSGILHFYCLWKKVGWCCDAYSLLELMSLYSTLYIRLRCAVGSWAPEVPLQKVDYFAYIPPAAQGYYCLRYIV